ncbi:MAG: peptidylprolyl isomerase [Bacillota bacterium]
MKKKLLTIFTLALLIPALSVGVMAQEVNVESPDDSQEGETEVVATVNGEELTRQELEQAAGTQQLIMQIYQSNQQFAQLLASSEEGQNLLEEFNKTKLEELINNTLLKQAAKESGLEVSDEEKQEVFQQQIEQMKQQNDMNDEELEEALKQQGIESMEEYQKMFMEDENLAEDILVQKFIEEEVLADIEVSDDKAEEYYENNKSQFEQGEQIKASHIMVESKEKADELYNKIQDGSSFSELAKENSMDDSSAEKGGDLGYISKGQFIPSFEEVAFDLEVGEVSEPVENKNGGFHIIKVTDKKDAQVQEFSEVKDKIKSQIKNQERQSAVQEYTEELRDDAEIEKNI